MSEDSFGRDTAEGSGKHHRHLVGGGKDSATHPTMHSSTTKNFLAPYVKSTEVEKLCFQLAWEFRDQVCGVFCSFTGAFEERVEQMVTDLPGTMLNALYTLLHHFTLRRVILP